AEAFDAWRGRARRRRHDRRSRRRCVVEGNSSALRGSRAGPHAIFMLVSGERRRATYEDLCKVPDHFVAEIIDGELFTSPRPALPHALASSMIGFALIGTFGGP